MKIGFDAKRAFYNSTGLGNYSRDSIRILSLFYPENDYFLYTPEAKENKQISFLKNKENILVRPPFSFVGNLFKKYWRTTNIIKDSEQINLGFINFDVISSPGHTIDHVIYYCEKEKLLFSGDTLFYYGCGRVFEGTIEQMLTSLKKNN